MQTMHLVNDKPILFTLEKNKYDGNHTLNVAVKQAWAKISPWWPLKNLIATNPLQGFEDLPFEDAVMAGSRHFQNKEIQQKLKNVNRETIKWCQVLFDEGQAVIKMPKRHKGLYLAWRELLTFDKNIHQNDKELVDWLNQLPLTAEVAILSCLKKLRIDISHSQRFLTLLLTTIPGWAGYVKYRTDWTQGGSIKHEYQIEQVEFLAMRVIIACLMYPEARELLDIQDENNELTQASMLEKMTIAEKNYKQSLVSMLRENQTADKTKVIPDAQLVFCIDVRSEPFRRAIEAQGNYETFGFAGFFGIPVTIENGMTGEEYASCPVLLSPKHTIRFSSESMPCHVDSDGQKGFRNAYKKAYHALKYTFTTPFALAEALGPWSGLWMGLRTAVPTIASRVKSSKNNHCTDHFNLDQGIQFKDQCQYAEGALRLMGLTSHFAPLVLLCGHGSKTENNAFATALDCGACGGHDGAANAKILAKILNKPQVRAQLKENGIIIPEKTTFLAALHNTTTDEVIIYTDQARENKAIRILNEDLSKARNSNCDNRINVLSNNKMDAAKQITERSVDWSQTRPEWGLARNAAFIVAPRSMTEKLNLQGRSFLHSYDWLQDIDGSSLTTILTAPMVVAQWINCQYLFSTIDNIAYGSGSKVTHNITGKMGIMQGNASDLMHGLPLQSVKSSDTQNYHEPQRLLTIVRAPRALIGSVISKQDVLKKLFGNGWVNLTCIDPVDGLAYHLQRDFSWEKHGL